MKCRLPKFFIFLLTISIFSGVKTTAYNTTPDLERSERMGETQLLYADALFDQGAYESAILEFKRYIFYNPQSDLLDYANYRIGQSYYYSALFSSQKRLYAKAREKFERFLKDYRQSPLRFRAKFMLGKTLMNVQNFAEARREFHQIIEANPDKKLTAQARYLYAWSYLSEKDWYSAVAEFRKVAQFHPDSLAGMKAERLADVTLKGIRLPRKSPTLARWMSTFLPGSGQIYVGKITNGLISTAFNLAFGYLLVDAIVHKRYVDAMGIYIIGARFYWGNIYSATQGALEYNQQIEKELLEKLKSL